MKTVKKVALPVLAVGAVVLTAGAALGALPAMGPLLGSIGIKGALAGILTSAAKAATFGAVGSLLTGGNPIKGATQGFLLGGAMGGVAALAAPAAGAGAAAQTAAGTAAGKGASGLGAAAAKATGATAAGTGAATAAAAVPGEAAMRAAWGVGAPASVASSAAPAASLAPVASTAPVVSSGGGLGSFLGNMHPLVQGQMISGIGQGIAANEDAKDRRREREAIENNYADTSGYFRLDQSQRQGLGNLQPAAQRYSQSIYGKSRLTYDPATGRVMAMGG